MKVVTHDLEEFVELAKLVEPLVRFEVERCAVDRYVERIVFRLYAPCHDGASVVVFEDQLVVPVFVGRELAKQWIDERMDIAMKLGAKPGRLEG